MLKILAALAASILIAAVITLATSPKPVVERNTARSATKGDRQDIRPLNSFCSQSPWPYYQSNCLGGTKRPAHQNDAVRVVTIDRLNAAN
jgi:hypothetical protein